jgi:hypothetical protein
MHAHTVGLWSHQLGKGQFEAAGVPRCTCMHAQQVACSNPISLQCVLAAPQLQAASTSQPSIVEAETQCSMSPALGSLRTSLRSLCRLVVLCKHSFCMVGAVNDLPCLRHPLKGCLDPVSGQHLAIGTESGLVHVYDLRRIIAESVAAAGAVGGTAPTCVLVHAQGVDTGKTQSQLASDRGCATVGGRLLPVCCVAWNPQLHMLVVAGRFPGATTTLLCWSGHAGGWAERKICTQARCVQP